MERAVLEELPWTGLVARRDRAAASAFTKRVLRYWVRKYGLRCRTATDMRSKGGLARDELESLVAAGLSIAQIADSVGRSKATVRHWLRDTA